MRDERAQLMTVKAPRRVHLGEYLTLLFENPLTVRYQIQEMIRAERIVREADIQHEIDTYNELLGGRASWAAAADRDRRSGRARRKLREWLGPEPCLYARLEDGTRIRRDLRPAAGGGRRLSSVQYLKFDVRGAVPVAVGVDLPAFTAETVLDETQRGVLGEDLASAQPQASCLGRGTGPGEGPGSRMGPVAGAEIGGPGVRNAGHQEVVMSPSSSPPPSPPSSSPSSPASPPRPRRRRRRRRWPSASRRRPTHRPSRTSRARRSRPRPAGSVTPPAAVE